jgi:hypothetical protein
MVGFSYKNRVKRSKFSASPGCTQAQSTACLRAGQESWVPFDPKFPQAGRGYESKAQQNCGRHDREIGSQRQS